MKNLVTVLLLLASLASCVSSLNQGTRDNGTSGGGSYQSGDTDNKPGAQ
jgi:hypothetical protein